MQKALLSGFLIGILCASVTFGADRKIIYPPGAKPGGSWSPGILVDGTLYISGQGGEDASGKIPGDFEAEVKQALDNAGAVLKAVATFQRMNAVYMKYFQDPRPTRTTVVVAKLVGPGNIEVTVTAKK